MVAAILQLQSTGLQDAFLTQDPEINIFKYRYHKYVNFATELVRIPPDDIIDFDKNSTCTIPKNGHLLSKLYLRIQVPPLVKTSGTYLSWSETLGYAIFKEGVELEIGGVVVDTFYPRFWDIAESFEKSDNDLGANLLLLRGDTYVSSRFNAEKSNDLVIPLKFWFTRDYSMALPIIGIHNQDIRLKFKFRKFQECINYDGTAPSINEHITTADIYAEYIYIDEEFLPEFSKASHAFLIEQVKYNGDEIIPNNAGLYNTVLDFNNPCKEIMFACVQKSNIDNNNYFNYSNTTTDRNIVSEIKLTMDGTIRFGFLPEVFNRLAYANAVHTSVPLKYVYSIPFCIKPQDSKQPTGSLNFSRFDNSILSTKLVPNNPESFIFIYALVYNIITIKDGILSFKFN